MKTQVTTPAPPGSFDGYWRDAEGRQIPIAAIKPIDLLREQLVHDLVARARIVSGELERFKAAAFGDIQAFVEASAEQYGVKMGGAKGNVTIVSYDGRFKILRAMQDSLVFDERLQVAKQLIDRCVHAWGEGVNTNIMALVNDAFQVGKEGKINTGRVLGLKRLNITDPDWLAAMQAIADSVRIAGSKPYLRFYERIGDTDQWRHISLDVASL